MDLRDASGTLVMVDDPRFADLFRHIEARGMTLLGHQGEPRNCWLPLAQMTVNNDRDHFRTHPQYHMYLKPEMPTYAQQLAARDRLLARRPRMRFVGVYMASLKWSVDELPRRLASGRAAAGLPPAVALFFRNYSDWAWHGIFRFIKPLVLAA